MAIGDGDMTEEVSMQLKATQVCEKLGLDVTVRTANAVPILLAMCEALTDKVLRLEKRMGNSDGRTIESVGRESAGGTD